MTRADPSDTVRELLRRADESRTGEDDDTAKRLLTEAHEVLAATPAGARPAEQTLGLASRLGSMGDTSRAEQCYLWVLHDDVDLEDLPRLVAQTTLGAIYAESQRPADAIRCLDAALETHDRSPNDQLAMQALHYRGKAQLALGRDARETLSSALEAGERAKKRRRRASRDPAPGRGTWRRRQPPRPTWRLRRGAASVSGGPAPAHR